MIAFSVTDTNVSALDKRTSAPPESERIGVCLMVRTTTARRTGRKNAAALAAVAAAALATTTAAPAPVAPAPAPVNPVVEAYNALRRLGLTRPVNSSGLRAADYVAVAAMARRQLGALADGALAGKASEALQSIRVIEKNANDCLPVAIGGPNPHHVRIGEVFASMLGFASDARKMRNAQIAEYVAGLK